MSIHRILAIWTFFWFISSPLGTLFSVLEKQEWSIRINIVVFVSRLLALIIGGYSGNARLTLLLFSVSGVLVYGYLSFVVMTEAQVPSARIISHLHAYGILSLPFLGAVSVIKLNEFSSTLLLLTSILAVIGYYSIALIRDHELRRSFNGLIGSKMSHRNT